METKNKDLSLEEEALIDDFRRCDPRRQEVIRRFARKLARLSAEFNGLITTNVVQFRRRKDDQ